VPVEGEVTSCQCAPGSGQLPVPVVSGDREVVSCQWERKGKIIIFLSERKLIPEIELPVGAAAKEVIVTRQLDR
jgi:hypothetical protein